MSDLVVNANAPKVTITIEADFRFVPEKISMKMSAPMPASVVGKTLTVCLANVWDEQIKAEARAAGYVEGKQGNAQGEIGGQAPNLPPAPLKH